ncbi:MAG: AbrB/MazE/SpoVT family DNA-binding domain-containing protein [bacterium]|nr:AbrB/MazE/SpoVT family DNA-binding domain-containing protein [bacterium]
MKRKLVQQGEATLMVSLPSKWIKDQELQKGDTVDIEENESKLVLSKDFQGRKKETSLQLTSSTESAVRVAIVNAYRSGYDLVHINYQNHKQYTLLQKILKDYIFGFEIVHTEEKSCSIENITEPSSEQFDVLLQKIFDNTRSLLAFTRQRLQGTAVKEDYLAITHRVHQYDNFCRRVISKTNKFGSASTSFWTFLTLLLHAQRELYHLNQYLDKNKILFTEKTLFDGFERMLETLLHAYKQKNIEEIDLIHTLEKELVYKDFYRIVQKGKKEAIVAHHLTTGIKELYLASSPLLTVILHERN